ncbi:kinesin-1 heavy chain-like [Branchiostoma lanceolatum]|uniref:kinesin-1 heavy chain-like n=1 Tax=Branchiostoma lanceolatum TaxID=7740 RepID=UPI003455A5F4
MSKMYPQNTAETNKAKWNLVAANSQRVRKLGSDLSAVSAAVSRLEDNMRALSSKQNQLRGDVGAVTRDVQDKEKQKPDHMGFEARFHRTMSRHEGFIKDLDKRLQQVQQKLKSLETAVSSATRDSNELRKRVDRNGNEIKRQKEQSRLQERRLMSEMNNLRSTVRNTRNMNDYKLPIFPGKSPNSDDVQGDVSQLQAQVSAILATQRSERSKSDRLFALISELQDKKDDKVNPSGIVQHRQELQMAFPAFAKDQPKDFNLTAVFSDLQDQVRRLEKRPYVGHCEVGVLGLPWKADGKTDYGGSGAVKFSKTFRTVPVVSAALYRLYHAGYQPVGIVVSADDITEKGFQLKIYGWDQTKLYSAGVQWMACG